MAANTNVGLLDPAQLFKRVVDPTNDSIRSIPGIGFSTKASLTSSSTGTVISATAAVGVKSINLYTNTTATITGSQALTVEMSPSDTDDIWIASTVTATPSTTSGTVVKGTAASNIVARRIRVTIAAAISSGTFDVYLVGDGI